MKFRQKFLIITAVLILIPMVVSTVVISLVVQRQQDALAWSRIDDVLQFVINDIDIHGNKLSRSLRVFAEGRGVLDNLEFILRNDREHSMYPSLVRIGNQLTEEMRKFAVAAEFNRIRMYYPDRRLMAVFWIDDQIHRFEFYLEDKEGRPTVLTKRCDPRDNCLPVQWKKRLMDGWPTFVGADFRDEWTVKETAQQLGMEVPGLASVKGEVLVAGNENAPTPVGIVIHKLFNLAYTLGLSERTEMDIDLVTASQAKYFPIWNAPEISPKFLESLTVDVLTHMILRLETSYYGGFFPLMDNEGQLRGVISARLSQDNTKAKTIEAIAYLVGIAFFSIALMIPVVLYLSRRFLEPIHALIRGTQAFGSGQLDYRLEEGNDEVGELAASFNTMAGGVKKAQQELGVLNLRLEEYNRDLEQKIFEATQALAARNKQMQDDLNLAAEFQNAIRPPFPEENFVKCAALYIPYKGGVSGDVYDVSLNPDGALNIFLGDATGHGMAAAFMTMMAQIGLDSVRGDLPCDETLRLLNALFTSRERGKSITGVYLRINKQGLLRSANAGHPPVLIVPAEAGEIIELDKGGGCPVGMFREEMAPYIEETYQLREGDRVYVYTDGVTEWKNPMKEDLGVERLKNYLAQFGDQPLEKVLDELLAHLETFGQGKTCDDDLTILGFQFNPVDESPGA